MHRALIPRRHKRKESKYRSGLEDKIVPGALAKGAKYESVTLLYPGGERKYTPDLELPNGILVEIKGRFTAADRTKTLRVLQTYPDLPLRFVFQKANTPLRKKSKTTYAAWCDKRGIPWAEGDVPADWYREGAVRVAA